MVSSCPVQALTRPGGVRASLGHHLLVVIIISITLVSIQSGEAKVAKNRVHLDLGCDDFAAELDRLERLGATRSSVSEAESLLVLTDLEGNEFCLLKPS